MISPSQILSKQELRKLFSKLKVESDKAITIIRSNPTKSFPKETSTVVEYYIFSLIINTGLRISEALKIELKDIGPDYIIIRKEISKNKKEGAIYFGNKTHKLLDEYIHFRNFRFKADNREALFLSRNIKVKFISRSHLHTKFKHWLNLCGIKPHYSIHSLRHTYATTCLNEGLSLPFVRDQLRHSNISVTSKYLHLTKENREKIKELF